MKTLTFLFALGIAASAASGALAQKNGNYPRPEVTRMSTVDRIECTQLELNAGIESEDCATLPLSKVVSEYFGPTAAD